MKTVAIIPAYNEGPRIKNAINDIKPHVDAVIVVDDCSDDDTYIAARDQGVHVLRHIVNRGQGAALQTGTDYALNNLGAEIIVHFDADGQMVGEEARGLIDLIEKDEADIVLGSRFLGRTIEMPLKRYFTLKLALLFTIIVSGLYLTDTHNGYRALSKKAANALRISLDRSAHASEILDLIKVKKLRHKEHPVTIRYTQDTLKKGQSFSSSFTIVKDLVRNKFFG
jgi:polyprenyl-phospho-N-acetylgalactosaminyl synthase